jgi:hypothetical protein
VQFAGRFGDEATSSSSPQLESVRPWFLRRPVVG